MFTRSATVRAFPTRICLLVLLFSLFQGVSCPKFVCCTSVQLLSELFPAWNSTACTSVQPLSGLFLPGIRLLVLLFSLCQGCFLPEMCLHVILFSYCQGCFCLEFVCCPTVQHLSRLFLPGIRLLPTVHSVQHLSGLFLSGICLLLYCSASVGAVPAWDSSAALLFTKSVQLLSERFLPGFRLLALPFSLFQGCFLPKICLPSYCSDAVRAVPA